MAASLRSLSRVATHPCAGRSNGTPGAATAARHGYVAAKPSGCRNGGARDGRGGLSLADPICASCGHLVCCCARSVWGVGSGIRLWYSGRHLPRNAIRLEDSAAKAEHWGTFASEPMQARGAADRTSRHGEAPLPRVCPSMQPFCMRGTFSWLELATVGAGPAGFSRSVPRRGVSPSVVLFMCVFTSQAAVLVLSPILVEISQDLQVSTAIAGQLRIFAAPVAALVAVLLARFGGAAPLRWILLASTLLVAVGSLASAASPSFLALALGQLPLWIGVAGLVAGGIGAAGVCSPPQMPGRLPAPPL